MLFINYAAGSMFPVDYLSWASGDHSAAPNAPTRPPVSWVEKNDFYYNSCQSTTLQSSCVRTTIN